MSAAVVRACSVLRQPPIHQKRKDQDDNRGRENVSASTLVTIDTATRTALHDWVQAPSTHGHCPNDRDVARCPRRRGQRDMNTRTTMPITPSKVPRTPRAPALNTNEERPEHCYCSAFPRGSGPCLPCYVRLLRLAEAISPTLPARLSSTPRAVRSDRRGRKATQLFQRRARAGRSPGMLC